ncbi:hypothetical protein T283_13235 [Listeria monocytogenes N53-1]|nr:hypothetical protein X842_0742 [Listeria monocytogenes Lm_1880]EZH69213.1 hypothetical protein T283_13235 [Listeria monocytogenes N53-1]UCK60183.1 hypothetical protein pLIS13_00261c [Listeria monocytogenes]UCZ49812.1 hypothetical protein pLIS41_00346c [Listeria innocua]UCK60476.1 hypothetical protein pLIS21_00256c [Listeria monocytogenes]
MFESNSSRIMEMIGWIIVCSVVFGAIGLFLQHFHPLVIHFFQSLITK